MKKITQPLGMAADSRIAPSVTKLSHTGADNAKTAEQRRQARNASPLLPHNLLPQGDSPKNSAPVSAHGKTAFQKSYLRAGDNRTADGAPAEAGVSPNGFKGGRK
jgi:hypothetical protein